MPTSFAELIQLDIFNKTVILRVDFNTPLDNGVVTDDTRIRASLDTITALIDKGAKTIIIAHLNRPNGRVIESERMTPVSQRLAELISRPVIQCKECVGPMVEATIQSMKPSDVIMLENIRFYQEELDNNSEFSKLIASYGDYFVQDAFGVVHRAHASTVGIPNYLPSYAGALLSKEVTVMNELLKQPKRPLVAIIGGSKISTKLTVLHHLVEHVDTLILGGAMVYTLFKAMGHSVGKSLVEDNLLNDAEQLLRKTASLNKSLLLPVDHCVVTHIDQPESLTQVLTESIQPDQIGVDIGPLFIDQIKETIQQASTVFWNGPCGIFEQDAYASGTRSIAEALANSNAYTIVGGGDSVAAVEAFGFSDQMDHISTGGGASLELISGNQLPGIQVLS